jgi:hypothetical protein
MFTGGDIVRPPVRAFAAFAVSWLAAWLGAARGGEASGIHLNHLKDFGQKSRLDTVRIGAYPSPMLMEFM